MCLACYRGPRFLGEFLFDRRHPSDDGYVLFPASSCYFVFNIISQGFTSKKYSSECRSEASNFIRLLCHTSALTLQMFISYVLLIVQCSPCSLFVLDVEV